LVFGFGLSVTQDPDPIYRFFWVECLDKNKNNIYQNLLPISARTLIASSACKEPTMPTTGPKMPASEQLETVSGAGALGYRHR